MPQLSNSQLVVLTAASQRPDRCVFPVTARLKGNAAGNVLKSLLNKGLIKEVRAKRDDTVWRHDEERGRVTLVATKAAFVALGIDPQDAPAEEDAESPASNSKSDAADAPKTQGKSKSRASRTAAPSYPRRHQTGATYRDAAPAERSDHRRDCGGAVVAGAHGARRDRRCTEEEARPRGRVGEGRKARASLSRYGVTTPQQ